MLAAMTQLSEALSVPCHKQCKQETQLKEPAKETAGSQDILCNKGRPGWREEVYQNPPINQVLSGNIKVDIFDKQLCI